MNLVNHLRQLHSSHLQFTQKFAVQIYAVDLFFSNTFSTSIHFLCLDGQTVETETVVLFVYHSIEEEEKYFVTQRTNYARQLIVHYSAVPIINIPCEMCLGFAKYSSESN